MSLYVWFLWSDNGVESEGNQKSSSKWNSRLYYKLSSCYHRTNLPRDYKTGQNCVVLQSASFIFSSCRFLLMHRCISMHSVHFLHWIVQWSSTQRRMTHPWKCHGRILRCVYGYFTIFLRANVVEVNCGTVSGFKLQRAYSCTMHWESQ